jgi:hypothetical protein
MVPQMDDLATAIIDPGFMLGGMFYASAMLMTGFGFFALTQKVKGLKPLLAAVSALLFCLHYADNGFAFF